MDSSTRAAAEKQAHVVCIPAPSQSHIKGMLKMARILHSKGIFITFVNTEFNHKRFLKSGGLQSLGDVAGFRFETIPDGLPPSDADKTQDIPQLLVSIFEKKMLPPFQNLLAELNAGTHQITSILSDGFMPFTADAAHSLGIPIVLLWTISACAFMGFYQFKNVLERGLVPLKVCIPAPSQSHIKGMLKMARILHSKGIFITFVNTKFNHKRFLKSGGLQSLGDVASFRFQTITDGLPPSDADKTQDIPQLLVSVFEKRMLPPFQNLLAELNAGTHQVTSILSDGFLPFTADAAHSLGIPIVLLWTISACAFMGIYQFKNVLERGLVPLKDQLASAKNRNSITVKWNLTENSFIHLDLLEKMDLWKQNIEQMILNNLLT
ncbi:hypothetical protein ACET3Z_028700 [Daucus carota]